MTGYDPGIGDQVLETVAAGNSLTAACAKLNAPRRSVRRWAVENAEFGRALQLARMEGLEVIADEILLIGDEVKACTDNALVNAARVRIDSRRWLLSKLVPQKYGDHLQLTGSGDQPLIPGSGPEANVPKLMAILSVLSPSSTNSELFDLAKQLERKLNGSQAALAGPEGGEDGRER